MASPKSCSVTAEGHDLGEIRQVIARGFQNRASMNVHRSHILNILYASEASAASICTVVNVPHVNEPRVNNGEINKETFLGGVLSMVRAPIAHPCRQMLLYNQWRKRGRVTGTT
jgi:hypothetical protein